MGTLHPALAARAKAVSAAHKHLAATQPNWSSLSSKERFKAVHAHVDRPIAARLADHVTALRKSGALR